MWVETTDVGLSGGFWSELAVFSKSHALLPGGNWQDIHTGGLHRMAAAEAWIEYVEIQFNSI
jgi:hypothetical protein